MSSFTSLGAPFATDARLMLNFLRKDLLLQIRDYKELGLLLLMPVLLIVILGLALGNLFDGGAAALSIRAGLVIEDDPTAGRRAFTARLAAADLPLPPRLALSAAAASIQPLAMFESVLTSPELAELLTVTEMDAESAQEQLEAGKLQAVITVPAGYTAELLDGMLLGDGGARLELALSDSSPLLASIVRDVVEGFAREVSFQSAVSQALQGTPPAAPQISGGIEVITAAESVSMVTYYTVAMAVMFALFVAGSISARAFLERSSLAFDRILISGARRSSFLTSKVLTGAIVVTLQLAFLFLAGTLLLGAFRGQPAAFWLAATPVTLLLGASVGGLGALLTAINFRAGNAAWSNVFSSVAVMVLASVGGSFFPVGGVPFLAELGKWTPNGAALRAYLANSQGLPLASYAGDLARLATIAVLLLAAAYALFPRRGGS